MNHEDGKTTKKDGWKGTLDPRLEAIGTVVVDAAIQVHRELGPGLLESAYEVCLVHELLHRGLTVERQKPLPVRYQGLEIEAGYRLDLLVEGCVIVELKAVEELTKIHHAQILTYLKLSGHRLGFLINFNAVPLKNGIRRLVN
ncbi:MAG: GxxExxY protein [Holophagaceae bacterium]